MNFEPELYANKRIFSLRWKSYIYFLCICATIGCHAQDFQRSNFDPETFISNLYRQQNSADIAYQDFYESLFQYYQNPLNLNEASVDDLRGLYLLSDKQIADILTHVREYGNFVSVYELQSIASLDEETIRQMIPFVTVYSAKQDWQSILQDLKKPNQHYLLLRHSRDVEKSRGYMSNPNESPKYLGDPNNLNIRYRIQKYKSFSVGLVAEKDAGEEVNWDFKDKKYAADFTSFHAIIYNKGWVKKCLIGDYQMQNGQGLVLSGGFFMGKGTETILTVRRNTTGIRPYSSLLETNYFRGAAVTIGNKNWDFTPFVSRKYIDASISVMDSTTADDDFASLRNTGLHRTITELSARKSVLESVVGANANYFSSTNNFQIGANLLRVEYDKFVQPSARYYNLYEFRGKTNGNGSVYYSYSWKNLSLFGEMGQSNGGGRGVVQGLLVSMGQKVDLSLLYRNFGPDFHTPYGNAFGENYKNSNEEGIYSGLKIKITYKTELTTYHDLYRFPWLKYRVSAPSTGRDYMASLKHKFNKKTILTMQYRDESKERDTYDNDLSRPYLAYHNRKYALIQLDSKFDKRFYLKSRIQGSTYSQPNSFTNGFMLVQDLGIEGRRVDVAFRAALFDVEDFENRQYVYENDVLYAFSFPFFSGKGMRNYALFKVLCSKQWTLWLKYGRTTYFDRNVIGSGNDQIEGNVQSEIRWQLRYSIL